MDAAARVNGAHGSVRVRDHAPLPAPRRRALLGAGLLGLLTACGTAPAGHPRGGPKARPMAEIDPDTAVRQRELRATLALAAQYDAALAATPAPTASLGPLRAQLTAQFTALGQPPSASSDSPSAAPAAVSKAPAPGRSALAAAERATVQGRAADLLAASPALARLIASIGASGAQRAVLLGGSAPAAVPMPAAAALAAPALAALQAALAAENAAVYGYGVIGAQLSGGLRDRATASLAAHQARCAALTQQIGAASATPAAAAPGYELPFPVTGQGLRRPAGGAAGAAAGRRLRQRRPGDRRGAAGGHRLGAAAVRAGHPRLERQRQRVPGPARAQRRLSRRGRGRAEQPTAPSQ